jgi:hypothetical protein
MLTKKKLFSLALLALAVWLTWSWFKPVSPESRFADLFADLSIGVPGYQKLRGFSHPEFILKGDFCTTDFVQSDTQFREFVSRLGVSADSILSSTSSWIRVDSKINPEYPWMLQVRGRTGSTSNTYDVHIEGQQPYD